MRDLLRRCLFGSIIVGPLASRLHAASDYGKTQFPESVSPGQTISITRDFDKSRGDITVKLFLIGSDSGTAQQTATGSLAADSRSVSIDLKDRLSPGRYYVSIDYGDVKGEVVPGELRVQANAVQIDSAYPTTAYQNDKGTFDFEILGRNFSDTNPVNNRIYVSGQGQVIKNWSATEKGCLDSGSFPCLWVESAEKLRVIGYKNERYQGPLTLSVHVGSSYSSETPLVLARMSESRVLILSIALFALLGFVIYRLVARGLRDNVIDGERYSPFWSFFIDKETNSYSLSKFQLLLFACVFVFAYLYVFLCTWLVQWRFVLPDIPSTLSGILGMSAGTAVVAAAITSSRGSKGAGPMRPSAADFISSGGQVIPERFQFFVWTIVARIGFIALLISQNPATIKEFPTFPQGLLYVMGVSATGYLGGKLARNPGPVIRNIAWDSKNNEITIQGQNLSSDADFFVDGTKLPIDPQAKDSLVTPTPQDQASDKTFCSKLKIRINPIAGVDLTSGDHLFRITNKDAQFAESRFTADMPTISKVELFSGGDIVASKDIVTIKVSGLGFRLGTMAQWTPSDAKDPIDLDAAAVQFIDPKTLKISLVPGNKGTGTLRISTSSGFATVATVMVS